MKIQNNGHFVDRKHFIKMISIYGVSIVLYFLRLLGLPYFLHGNIVAEIFFPFNVLCETLNFQKQ